MYMHLFFPCCMGAWSDHNNTTHFHVIFCPFVSLLFHLWHLLMDVKSSTLPLAMINFCHLGYAFHCCLYLFVFLFHLLTLLFNFSDIMKLDFIYCNFLLMHVLYHNTINIIYKLFNKVKQRCRHNNLRMNKI